MASHASLSILNWNCPHKSRYSLNYIFLLYSSLLFPSLLLSYTLFSSFTSLLSYTFFHILFSSLLKTAGRNITHTRKIIYVVLSWIFLYFLFPAGLYWNNFYSTRFRFIFRPCSNQTALYLSLFSFYICCIYIYLFFYLRY